MKSGFLLFTVTLFAFKNCATSDTASAVPVSEKLAVEVSAPKDFVQYWYAGKAEVNSYNLEQSRYGETRKGDAVMVFVTEDFSKSKQVKLDNPNLNATDAVSVLKLNYLKKFNTGIYDYSMMQSVFTPVDLNKYPKTLKSTFSSQDWCGHVFSQINAEEKKGYRLTDFSYFEKEGDTDKKLKEALLEDELWSRLRINPESIPTGEVKLIPSQSFARLNHKPLKATSARIQLNQKTESTAELKIEYLHFDRTLVIEFENDFPFRILGWTESNGNQPPTKAVLKQTIKSAYWGQNGNDDLYLRDSLKLRF